MRNIGIHEELNFLKNYEKNIKPKANLEGVINCKQDNLKKKPSRHIISQAAEGEI